MTWPAAQVKVNFDAAGDDPKQARSEFAGNVDKFNQMRSHVSSYIQGLLDDADAAAARTTLAAAALASPTFTGTPAAPTASVGTDTTQLATTAFVLANGISPETAIVTTSGTAHGFTSIKAGANRITFQLDVVSLSGSNELYIQIGDSGGYEASGYSSRVSEGTSDSNILTAFIINRGSGSTDGYSGLITFNRIDGNTWVSNGGIKAEDVNSLIHISAGRKTLDAELDRIQIISSGSDTFDAGKVNVFVE